ncbi:hypothetical protein GTO87_02915 [Ligilactobacillus saerimneri]|uniref:Uncharacterized protein n=1 Tax=Ligilactobacillus saerimneri TaxID=228229 RepID=A0A7H9EK35_9LACO|nr:hypothetical protein [Ligilactobacillus saerimneri]QLL77642.1 hypothetical protein GTO87_02915 [Ligilactobacillus saerimneri]
MDTQKIEYILKRSNITGCPIKAAPWLCDLLSGDNVKVRKDIHSREVGSNYRSIISISLDNKRAYRCELVVNSTVNKHDQVSRQLNSLLEGLRGYDTKNKEVRTGFKPHCDFRLVLTDDDKLKIDQVSDRLAAIIEYVKGLENKQ